ncbi:hypothetical protein [Herpetosiphon llansteffanensis]|uniref:hypothetical protein n=1 Tax=Herpetosiphon llansteffanensis TaxID=2094568 RepID=UPI000D7BF35C|nr:hypothetical protein [Herpetosiphon llansteffanensis]
MATDAARLLRGLIDYQQSLDKHQQLLRIKFDQLKQRWHAFSSVYEGDAAREFRIHWLRTSQNFEDYLSATTFINQLLQARIQALSEAEQINNLG